MKRLISAAISGAMALSILGGMSVNAEETDYREGLLPDPVEAADEFYSKPEDFPTTNAEETFCCEGFLPDPVEIANEFYSKPTDFPTTFASLPSSVDLSTSPCFPDIGSQGNLGNCVAFAITYYQYSYEVNRLNNVTSKSDRVIYSTKWTYNLANEAMCGSVTPSSVYKVLENFGCLKNSDYPYTGMKDDFTDWPAMLDNQKIEALQTRLVKSEKYEVPISSTITNANDSKLDTVKQLLNNGKILTVGSRYVWNAAVQNGESIAFRCSDAFSGHMMTVVGYDDNKSYDVNGNGTIEPYEKGAFKIANSHGTSFNEQDSGIQSNTGYFWVMYDALNATSANTLNNWESKYSGTRVPAFYNTGDSGNAFYHIDVAHKNVNFIGKLTVNTTDREALDLNINRLTSTVWSDNGAINLYPYNTNNENIVKEISYIGRIYFDYDSFATLISTYCTGYNWFVNIKGASSNDTFLFSIVDNLGKTIKANKSLTRSGSRAYGYHNISLQKGDLNYDGALTMDDVNVLQQYNLSNIKLSNVQYYIGDYNNDGVVTNTDTIRLQKDVLANGG